MDLFDRVFLSAEVSPGSILNLDMSLIINGLIHGAMILLLIGLLASILYNPVKNFMADRAAGIRGDIESARLDREKVEEIKANYQEFLDSVEKEREEILKTAHRKANEEHSRIVADAHKAAEDLKAKANDDIELEMSMAADEIKRQIAEISALIAGRFTEAAIDRETQAGFIDEALSDWGEKA
jgi:F-type H+-transporting ATPase subunit b